MGMVAYSASIYTWDISYHRISFLDVSVGLDNGFFCTDVYSKPTDAHQYLNFKSCHPPHVRPGLDAVLLMSRT